MNPSEHPVFDNHKLRQSDPQPEIDIERIHDFHSHKNLHVRVFKDSPPNTKHNLVDIFQNSFAV